MDAQIFFTGLIALVLRDNPQSKHCDAGAAGSINVLMLNGMETAPHKPRLIVAQQSLVAQDGGMMASDPDQVLVIPGGQDLAVWDLTGQRLTISNMPKLQLGDKQRKKSTTAGKKWDTRVPDKTGSNDSTHFSWIADLQEACPDAGGVRKECADGTCDAVSSMMSFDYKQTSTSKLLPYWFLDPDYKTPDPNWYGMDNNSTYEQSLADGIKISADIGTTSDGNIQLTLTPLHGSGDAKTIYVKDPNGNQPVIWVSNVPSRLPSASSRIPHFRSYYGLLKNDVDCRVPVYENGTGQLVKCAICSSCSEPPN